MKGLLKYLVLGMVFTSWGCGSFKVADKKPTVTINQSLFHWMAVDSDSVNVMKKRDLDSKIGDLNLRRLRDQLDTDKSSPYWGESMYYMLQDLFKR